jgi:hypothetical protein
MWTWSGSHLPPKPSRKPRSMWTIGGCWSGSAISTRWSSVRPTITMHYPPSSPCSWASMSIARSRWCIRCGRHARCARRLAEPKWRPRWAIRRMPRITCAKRWRLCGPVLSARFGRCIAGPTAPSGRKASTARPRPRPYPAPFSGISGWVLHRRDLITRLIIPSPGVAGGISARAPGRHGVPHHRHRLLGAGAGTAC